MNEDLIKQFIQNQQKEIDLQSKQLDKMQEINDNLKILRDTFEITPEKEKENNLLQEKIKKEHEKEISDFKALIKSLDNKTEINTLDSDLQSLNSNVTTSFKTVEKGFDSLSFNTQYSNNLDYFFIVGIGLVLGIYMLYKFVKIFI